MTNYKNKLQEFAQKNGLTLPRYYTKREGGTDHMPTFKSTISFIVDRTEITKTAMGNNKKAAENNAAEKMCDYCFIDSSENSDMSLESVEEIAQELSEIIITTKKYEKMADKPTNPESLVVVENKILMIAKIGELFAGGIRKFTVIGKEYENIAERLNGVYGEITCKKIL